MVLENRSLAFPLARSLYFSNWTFHFQASFDQPRLLILNFIQWLNKYQPQPTIVGYWRNYHRCSLAFSINEHHSPLQPTVDQYQPCLPSTNCHQVINHDFPSVNVVATINHYYIIIYNLNQPFVLDYHQPLRVIINHSLLTNYGQPLWE